MASSTETDLEVQVKESEVDYSFGFSLTLYNDDYNTFDHVIACLIKICRHSTEQATQCAYLVHYKGKCIVKEGSMYLLNGMCNKLQNEGLHAHVEQV